MLIISPYFPPVNAADMHRVRTSLPYFQENGWHPVVVTVDEKYIDTGLDKLLPQSVPAGISIYKVKAFNKALTSKLGLGSIALRSLWFYRKKVDELLASEKFDLVYFSTTQFAVCVAGPHWKKKFKIPYVIDMQDPWHTDYYQDKPKEQRPRKYWFSYRLNKYLEPLAIKEANGLISVSQSYIDTLKSRYPKISDIPAATITFGAFEPDLTIAQANKSDFASLLDPNRLNIVYAGRGGTDMYKAISPCFKALKKGLSAEPDLFKKIRFYFIGTSYAPAGQEKATILPLAKEYGIEECITELPARLSYYNALATLSEADALFIPGSDNPQYTASKIYPYLMLKKPLLAVFNEASSVVEILSTCTSGAHLFTFGEKTGNIENGIYDILLHWLKQTLKPITLTPAFSQYSAEWLTKKQTDLFNAALAHYESKNRNA